MEDRYWPDEIESELCASEAADWAAFLAEAEREMLQKLNYVRLYDVVVELRGEDGQPPFVFGAQPGCVGWN